MMLVGGRNNLIDDLNQIDISVHYVVLQYQGGVLLRHHFCRAGLLLYLRESALLLLCAHFFDDSPGFILNLFIIVQAPLDAILLIFDLVLYLDVLGLVVDQFPPDEDVLHLLHEACIFLLLYLEITVSNHCLLLRSLVWGYGLSIFLC